MKLKHKYLCCPDERFFYRIQLIGVVSGDFVDCQVDLGFDILKTARIQLIGIKSPPICGEAKEAGIAAKEHLKSLLERQEELFVKLYHIDETGTGANYGILYGPRSEDGLRININEQMVQGGHATAYDGVYSNSFPISRI